MTIVEQVIRDRFSGFRAIGYWRRRLEERIEEADDEIENAYFDRSIRNDLFPALR